MKLVLPDGRSIRIVNPSSGRAKMRAFVAHVNLEGSGGGKSFDVMKEGERIVDYVNVEIEGYLSTFMGTTAEDRDGDRVKPGAFTETIPKFLKNPVLLANHRNDCNSLVGKFTYLEEDRRGLFFRASISNSPAEAVRDVRYKVAEDMLRTCSMGGVFTYDADGRTIVKVALYEGSLVPLPANPDAIFETRELTEAEWQKALAS